MDIVVALDSKNLHHLIKCSFRHLDEVSLCRASAVSHSWRRIIKDSGVWQEKYDQLIDNDFYTNSIAATRRPNSKKSKKALFEISHMTKYWRLKRILKQVYDKSGSYDTRGLLHKPKTFANRITSFVVCSEFIGTSNMDGDVQVCTYFELLKG